MDKSPTRVTADDADFLFDAVVAQFELGRLVEPAVVVPGGLSNRLWRLSTERGTYAVKQMVVNADEPDFVGNIEAAFAVERRAHAAGVAMPAPVADPHSGHALARVSGALVRVHAWVDGMAGQGSPVEAAALLASIHATGSPRRKDAPDSRWSAGRWGSEIAALARQVGRQVPSWVVMVDSHRDMDRKNVLRRVSDGALIALDWDAAGPTCAVREAVAVALDWAGTEPGAFRVALAGYRKRSDVAIPAEPWVFGGWVASHGGWLDYNATRRADTELGRHEVTATLARLHEVATCLDTLVDALR